MCLTSICACSQTPVIEYVPKNKVETEIIKVLIQYQEAKNSFDIHGYLECLHEQGRFEFDANLRKDITKNELKERLPRFWARLKENNRDHAPMLWESMNGNYFQYGWFAKPQIKINTHSAEVKVVFTNGWWSYNHTIVLLRQNHKWLISHLGWEPF
jgi:hypothetical protein